MFFETQTQSAETNGIFALNAQVNYGRDAQVLAEYDNAGNLLSDFTFGDDLIQQTRGGTTSYFGYDGSGSTRILTDSTGTVSDSYDYDGWGVGITSTGTTQNDYRFTGEYFDSDNSHYYLRARNYNPSVGRFSTVDPFQGYQTNPTSLHRYQYADNNPVMMIDPTGMFTLIEKLTVAGISSTIVSTAIPTIRGILTTFSGRTNRFGIQFFIGASVGKGLYVDGLSATIWELPAKGDNSGNIYKNQQRSAFIIAMVGVGGGVEGNLTKGADLMTPEIVFETIGNRNVKDFRGFGSIISGGVSFIIGRSLTTYILADGTVLTPDKIPSWFDDVSIGASAGASVSMVGAYWYKAFDF